MSVLFDGNTDDFRYQRFWAYSNSFMGRGYYCYKYLNFYSSSVSQKNFPIIRLPEIYFIIMECGTLAEANNAYELYCTARNISFVPFTESDRQERIIVEFMREYTGEGQNFFMYKRNNVRRMLFASEDCSVEQYMIPIPEGEFLENACQSMFNICNFRENCGTCSFFLVFLHQYSGENKNNCPPCLYFSCARQNFLTNKKGYGSA